MRPLPKGSVRLFYEDFRSFPLGPVPSDYTPLREYHYFSPGYTGRWHEGTMLGKWRPNARWLIVEEEGQTALEQTRLDEGVPPTFITGEEGWRDYRVQTEMWIMNPSGRSGLLFLYRHSLDYYGALLDADRLQIVRAFNENGVTALAETPLQRDCDRKLVLSLELKDGQATARVVVGGEEVAKLSAPIDCERTGKIGLLAENPTRFYWVDAVVSEATKNVYVQTRDKEQRELDAAKERYPKPVLARTIPTPGFGAGKALRFGDLDGDGRMDFLIAQNQQRVVKDSYSMISCLTAVNLDGHILWQKGRPSPHHALVTNDVAMQIYDIDGDGANEVIYTKDFRMIVLDGKTGEVKREAPTPVARSAERLGDMGAEDAFYRIVGDCIYICNVRGLPRAQDIVVKDRYKNIWVYDDQFNLLWAANCRTGHFPLACDFNGDGKDELLVGYTLFSSSGEKLWELPLGDHADGLGVMPGPDGVPLIIIAAGDEGFLFVDIEGNVMRHERMGHVQTVNVGNFRPDLEGLEYATITYWRYPGIFSMYDAHGDLLFQKEPLPIGSHIKPVNWTGRGDELILFSASPTAPGLLDGYGRSVVNLPDDGHPELCVEPLDALGDPRDEIVAWDPERIWIYTQDAPYSGERLYAPKRPDAHNYSNYRCEISLPHWISWPPSA